MLDQPPPLKSPASKSPASKSPASKSPASKSPASKSTAFGSKYQTYMARPMIHMLATMACNLRCTYCPVDDWLLKKPTDSLLNKADTKAILDQAREPYAVHLGGGEPLMNPDIIDFVRHYGQQGHLFSFDTNATHNAKQLGHILDNWDPDWIAYFDASHHLDQRVPLKTIIKNIQIMRDHGMHSYVKYIGRPGDREVIDENINILEDQNIGTWVSVYHGPNTFGAGIKMDDRILPDDYNREDLRWLLGHVRSLVVLPPLLGGMNMAGSLCRAGNDFLLKAHLERGSVTDNLWPCCHGQSINLDYQDTYFGGAPRQKKTCQIDGPCYVYFLYNTDIEAIEGYGMAPLFEGPVAPLTAKQQLDFLDHICLASGKPAKEETFALGRDILRQMAEE